MKRREFISLLGGAGTVWPFAAQAQQAGGVVLDGSGSTLSMLGVFLMKKILLATAALLCAVPAHAHISKTTCFSRVYDKTHLANHPDQLVKEMNLKLEYSTKAVYFTLKIKTRGQDDYLDTEGDCNFTGPGMVCSPGSQYMPNNPKHTDDGSVSVQDKGKYLMLYINKIIRLSDGHEPVTISRGKDHDVFRLNKTECQGDD